VAQIIPELPGDVASGLYETFRGRLGPGPRNCRRRREAAPCRLRSRANLKNSGTRELIKDDNPGNIPFKVNGPYPEKEPLSTVPPKVLASLPQLSRDSSTDSSGRI